MIHRTESWNRGNKILWKFKGKMDKHLQKWFKSSVKASNALKQSSHYCICYSVLNKPTKHLILYVITPLTMTKCIKRSEALKWCFERVKKNQVLMQHFYIERKRFILILPNLFIFLQDPPRDYFKGLNCNIENSIVMYKIHMCK